MESSVVFTIVMAVICVAYYTAIIAQDLCRKPGDGKSQGESFDISDTTDERGSVAIGENDGGFSVDDNQCEIAYEGEQFAEPTEEAIATTEESKPHVLKKIQNVIEKKMERVNITYSDPVYSEELSNIIIARGLCRSEHDMVKVELLSSEI